MGNIMKSIVFMPPYRVSIRPTIDDTFLTTRHGSRIMIKEIEVHKSDFYIIFSHGNAEDIYSAYDWCYNYLVKSVFVNVVTYEYTGYNYDDNPNPRQADSVLFEEDLEKNKNQTLETLESQSHTPRFDCKEEYLYNDIEAVYEYLVQIKKVKPQNIILLGRSLGSGPSCNLAQSKRVGGLIINSGFTSILRVAFNFRFTFFFDMFSNIDKIKKVECPILVIHSIKDEIVPFEHAIELYEASPHKFDPLFVDGTGHNNIDKICCKVFDQINDFLQYIYPGNYDKSNISKPNNFGHSIDSFISG